MEFNYDYADVFEAMLNRENGITDPFLNAFIMENFGNYFQARSIHEAVSGEGILLVDERSKRPVISAYLINTALPYVVENKSGVCVLNGEHLEHFLVGENRFKIKSHKLEADYSCHISEKMISVGNVYKAYTN